MTDLLPAAAAPNAGQHAIACMNVSVRFGDFVALDDVTIGWDAGSVNVVVGQNGAGKTTLARVLGGLQYPSSGAVQVNGLHLPPADVHEARDRGVELVHQHFALPATFTVAQALELFSSRPRRGGVFTRKQIARAAREDLAGSGLDISPSTMVGDLPVETLQGLEVTRALASHPRVLVLDEPTAVLSPPAVKELFSRVRALAVEGICVILVLHKLSEVFEIAETVSVLRAGQLMLSPTPIGEVDRRDLAKLVVGNTQVQTTQRPERPTGGVPLIELSRISAQTRGHDAALVEAQLAIAAGEIVGVAGVEGNGQRSLVEALLGIAPTDSGTLTMSGRDITGASVKSRRAGGLRVIPFERNTEGVSRTSALWENHALLGSRRGLRPRAARAACKSELDRWDVRYRSVEQQAGELSGGNVQKTILARELSGDVGCLVAAHPTRGLDIAATESVRSAITEAASGGTAVLLVSADLDELFQLSHRLVVMSGGRIVAEFEPPYDIEAVGWAMTAGVEA